MRQSLLFFLPLLVASRLAAQTPAELAAVTPQTAAPSCVGGNCQDGIGTQLLGNTPTERRFFVGHFAGGEPAGIGTDCTYALAPPDPADPATTAGAGPHYRLVSQCTGQYGPGLKFLPVFKIQCTFANTVRHDTLEHTETRFVNGIETGTSCVWPRGSAQGGYVRETGSYKQNGVFEQGTLELHGLPTLPRPTVRVEVSFTQYRRECLQGDCRNGPGVLLRPGCIQAGTFRNYDLQKGTIEVFGYGGPDACLALGVLTLVGKFDSEGQAAARFVPYGTSEDIEGSVRRPNYDFSAAPSYYFTDAAGLRYVRDEAPAWLRDVYGPLVLEGSRLQAAEKARAEAARAEKARLARLAQDAYDATHPAEVAARQAASQAAQSVERRAAQTRPADRAYQPTEHEVTCSSCGGSGWVSGQSHAYGQSVSTSYDGRSQCHTCGGRGKTTSKY